MPQLNITQLDSLISGVNSIPLDTYAKILNDRYITPNGEVIDMDLLESWRMSQARQTELKNLLITAPQDEDPQPPPPPLEDICSALNKIENGQDFVDFINSKNVSYDTIKECLGLESSDVDNLRNYWSKHEPFLWDQKDLEPVPQDSTDIFFIGTPKSAKTCVIAATLNNLSDSGRKVLIGDTKRRVGNLYQAYLIRCLRLNVMPKRTANDQSNYMSLGVMHDVNKPKDIHRWNFIEMSGERVKNTHEGIEPDINPEDWLNSKNRKVINFVIDCDYDPTEAPQDLILNSAFDQLEEWKVFDKTDVVNFLVNKIDIENTTDPREFAKELVIMKFSGLLNSLKLKRNGGLFNRKKFVINVLPISIGTGFTLGGSYMKTPNNHYINMFIDELIDCTSYRTIN